MKPAKEHAHAACIHTQNQSSRWRLALGAVCLTALAIAVAAACSCSPAKLLTFGCSSQLGQQQRLGHFAACKHLWGSHRQLCEAYYSSSGEDKWLQAPAWRRASPDSYACSGIEASCLQQDMGSSEQGSTCTPLQEGVVCSTDGKRCNLGSCQHEGAGSMLGRLLSHACSSSSSPAGHNSVQYYSRDEFASNVLPQTAAPAEAPSHRQLQATTSSSSSSSSWPTLSVSVDSLRSGRTVPETFLATSHEFTRIFDYGNPKSVAAWANVFGMLSSSPIFRVGGASQDKMLQAPGDDVWLALKRLQSQTNCRFIFGLPLWQSNAVQLSRQIINATQKHFGKAVLGYELGNEPEFWPTGLGGYNTTTGQWQAGFEAYAQHFHRVAQALNPCSLPGGKKMLSGPGWGNVNTQPTDWMAHVLWAGKDCYLGEASVHYYPYVDNTTVTAAQLLSEDLQEIGLSKFRDYQRIAASAKLGLRISETNSLYGGGRPQLSDTMTGALWVADALFEFARAGAAGFHLHFGVGGAPDGNLGQPNTGVQTNFYYETAGGVRREYRELVDLQINPATLPAPVPWPSIHVPWYGYLFWTVAAAGGYGRTADTSFVPVKVDSSRWQLARGSSCTANIKVWALKSKSGDLRMAIINKDEQQSCNINISLDKQYCKQATLSRLLSPGGLLGKAGISWQGQSYENAGYSGKLQGQQQLQQLLPQTQADRSCVFAVAAPAASAALVVSKATVVRVQTEGAALRVGKPSAVPVPGSSLASQDPKPTAVAVRSDR